MAEDRLVRQWEALQAAVGAEDWPEVGVVATKLEADLSALVEARSLLVASARKKFHRDGLYAIGWQHVLAAPREVRKVVERYNATLHALPGGVGPQPRR